ncbi:uncharacterized protein LOC118814108 [Colossoma macropomum]|uniref:uncharacterized protein LOC118814108 n=1 Tax=Colossoma macropomum TaxID=42526 RepID=UPI001864E925|nr:uncharacterized protein LOC118814108 [Colossoma macropomum]
MTSQERELRFVTWNTRGIKDTSKLCQKYLQWLCTLKKLEADIAFIQETHIGPKGYKMLEMVKKSGWKVYFTVYKPRSKGVAILIRNDVPFEYICHDEDHSGSYIVLFCHLYGELYTLVNVYNHIKDRKVLYTLKEYLQETAEGVLVVGGDFNIVLDSDLDRRSSAVCTGSSALRIILENFIASLNLRDVWAHLHSTDSGFTRSEKDSYSRLDMFFMPGNTVGRVSSCEIYKTTSHRVDQKKISDHEPLVLTLIVQQQPVKKIPDVASMVVEFGYNGEPDRRSGKISGAEILSAIKSLTESGEQRPDNLTVEHYKKFRCPMTEVLKINYNLMIKNKWIPPIFKKSHQSRNGHIFNVDYLIFSLILAQRLKVFITPSFRNRKKAKRDLSFKITFANVPQKIKCSFLTSSLENLKPIHPAPPQDFSILQSLLRESRRSSGKFRRLRQSCPLTNPILTLALNQLKDQILRPDSTASISHYRHVLLIWTETNRIGTVVRLVKQFKEVSGIRLKMSLNNDICP